MAVAPHALAAQTGIDILREGGNAIEAAIGMAASLSALYPHMTGIGGDSFWLCHAPGSGIRVVDASGRSPRDMTADFYRRGGFDAVPTYGPLAACTVAGTLSGWQAAYDLSRAEWAGRLPLARLLADAIAFAEDGYAVTADQVRTTGAKLEELRGQPGFSETFLIDGKVPALGARMRLPRLAAALRQLAALGLQDFYAGELARAVAGDLERVGSPLRLDDLLVHQPVWSNPLVLRHSRGALYNVGAPTQGVASLLILAAFDKLGGRDLPCESADYVHLLVEATKQAYGVRDRYVRDPMDMGDIDLGQFLEPECVDRLAARIDMRRAAPWQPGDAGDTTWFGAIDRWGRAVSAIQSLYHGFGSGVVLPQTGICWHNRGTAFSLEEPSARYLRPGRKPFHTLSPAMAYLNDGRLVVYGTMGGDGQPQTQAAIFTRYVEYGQALQRAISAPRWVIGRGAPLRALKLERRFPQRTVDALKRRGHPVELVDDFDSVMGHAGALVLRPDGVMEGGADPRADGAVAAF